MKRRTSIGEPTAAERMAEDDRYCGIMPWVLLWWRVLAFFLARYELILAPDGAPYISRWHFPRWLARRMGARYLFLHHFHTSDPDRGWHNHPWEWCESRILRGAYVQEKLIRVGLRWHVVPWGRVFNDGPWYFREGDVNRLTNECHRVILDAPTVWTLFRAGPKHGRSWGFRDRSGAFTPANG